MKKTKAEKILRILLIVLLTGMLAAMLSACSIINSLFITADNGDEDGGELTSISISVDEGIDIDNLEYTVTLGSVFSLKATPNEGAPSNITYKWFYSEGDAEATEISGQSSDILEYRLESYSSGGYSFYAIADGIKSTNTILLKTDYATLDSVSITSSTHSISERVIQQKIVAVSEISFSVTWNERYLDPSTEYSFKWYLGDAITESADTRDFTYNPTAIEGDTKIRVRVYVGTNYKEAILTVSVIERYHAVEEVVLTVNSGATEFGTGIEKQYRQIATSGSPVSVSAACEPHAGTDNSAAAVWRWTRYDTTAKTTVTSVITDVDREYTFTPAYGENLLTAEIGKVESRHISIIVLSDSDYNDLKTAVEKTFVWRSGVYNSYITSQDDFNIFMNYIAAQRKTTQSIKNDSGQTTGIENINNAFYFKAASYFEINSGSGSSPGTLDLALESISDAGSYLLSLYGDYLYFDTSRVVSGRTVRTAFGNPTKNYEPAADVEQVQNVLLHYTELATTDRRSSLPIDSKESYPDNITNSDMLYRVVGWGYKPTFGETSADRKIEAIYNSARSVLLTYISEDMTDLEKVRIIYEWIAQKTDYDYAIVEDESLTSAEKLSYNAFFLEGIFTDADGEGHGQGVCDARSKALVLLCGMEGIPAVRVTGEGKGENHAWNKVLLDVDDDGVKEWFFCDPTWGDRGNGNASEERLTMQYFLVTDEYASSTHIADAGQYNPSAVTEFNVYAVTVVENGDKDFDLYIDSTDELKNAVEYAKANDIYLDVKVSASVAQSKRVFAEELTKYAKASVACVDIDEANGLYLFRVV